MRARVILNMNHRTEPGDRRFLVDLGHDGDITFVDPPVDLEYEIAFGAMGGVESAPMALARIWKDAQVSTIIGHVYLQKTIEKSHLIPPENIIHLIALDWAEHVLPAYLAEHPNAVRPIGSALREARRSWRLSEPIKEATIGTINDLVDAAQNLAQRSIVISVAQKLWADWNATSALSYALRRKPYRCAELASQSAARGDTINHGLLGFRPAQKAEATWQGRRFVDVIGELQAGKKWPPLGATP
jgi:hypothetical protein